MCLISVVLNEFFIRQQEQWNAEIIEARHAEHTLKYSSDSRTTHNWNHLTCMYKTSMATQAQAKINNSNVGNRKSKPAALPFCSSIVTFPTTSHKHYH
ncbi:hypothetical protein XELAEV_18035817mg [Xenopus laevis]|uniref:Uncharacterized protein n=1 Tax=Xenopus laevis TaxID=8355 RepID=A0A974CGB5_XENLA|nr:hypothetical protein XELAEV_18035817mg [Xenopus laevis]